ncbi:MAG: GNAT family N-acetyltransferase [Anaerolineales bacterium]
MNAQAVVLPGSAPRKLRPFDLRGDLLAVADLVELCFADTLDADGRLYIRQMRNAARGIPTLDAYGAQSEASLGGYVWVENEKLVGNLSLVPHRYEGRRLYLIANVAVHPDHRRRGIARELTLAALQEAERRGRPETWLQVDEKNLAAVDLYRGMGFTERMRRTSWRLYARREAELPVPADLDVRLRRPADWPAQKRWLQASYPADVRWQLPLNLNLLQPGWRGALERAFGERRVQQWSARRDGELLGVLSWQSSSLETDRLWLAADPQQEAAVIPALTAYARLRPGRTLALNYPGGQAQAAFEGAGYRAARTLIWMSYPWVDR